MAELGKANVSFHRLPHGDMKLCCSPHELHSSMGQTRKLVRAFVSNSQAGLDGVAAAVPAQHISSLS